MQSRGSIETGDLITDVTGQPLNVSFEGTNGEVHSGVMSAATYIQCCTRSTLQKAARDYCEWPLLITGHSLGGMFCCNFTEKQNSQLMSTSMQGHHCRLLHI